MHFNVEEDQGSSISGYLVPDSFSDTGAVRVRARGRELAIVRTDSVRLSLVVAGRHETGLCGFSLTEHNIPGLADLDDLEILDVDTGTLIYRRAPENLFLASKILRLETHLVPLSRIDRAIGRRFCHVYKQCERAGFESTTQMFHLLQARSLYIAGRIPYRSFEELIAQRFKVICLIHDPYEELAERLLFLWQRSRRGGEQLDLRDRLYFEPAITFACSMQFDTVKALRKNFDSISLEAAAPLSNPISKQLTSRNHNDAVRSTFLGAAIDTLASFAVVGLRAEAETFARSVMDVLGPAVGRVPVVPRCSTAIELAEKLRQVGRVQDLLGCDMALYTCVTEAFNKASEM